MLKKFLRNCKKPEGSFGRLVLRGMNSGHGPIAAWALDRVSWKDGSRLLDVGCGGGANIARMLRRYPHSEVDGVDYSQQSVSMSQKKNTAYLGKRCRIVQGDVMCLPFPDGSYDAATAVETVYFWPRLSGGLEEVLRILRPGGQVLVVCEMSDPVKGEKWSRNCQGMTIYTPAQLKEAMQAAGFREIRIMEKGVWAALIGTKPPCRKDA